MASIPSGFYTCEFEARQFVVNEDSIPAAEIAVNYSKQFISINYIGDKFVVGVGDLELITRDGYSLDNTVELAGSSLDIGTYFANYLPSGQLSYDMESIGEIRLVYENGILKIYRQ
ncbi:MAG: hypothetical protein HKN92_12340 [Chitinophagales bacterium]|nr:hypothetical protein [Chitinophagales bacterium]